MKKIVLIIITIIALIPLIVNAETEEIVIQDQTLKEACDDFELTCNHTQQDVNPLLPNLYVFIGDKCSYCGELLVFLSEIYDTYNNRANFVIFNVSKDKSNYALYKSVAKKFNDDAKSVPFIAIDKKFYSGFQEKDRQSIIISIEGAYENKERYDVIGEIMNGNYDVIEKKSNSIIVIVVILSLVAAMLIFMSIYLKKN